MIDARAIFALSVLAIAAACTPPLMHFGQNWSRGFLPENAQNETGVASRRSGLDFPDAMAAEMASAHAQQVTLRSVKIWEGGCFYYATCTTYEMEIRADGSYRLDARDFVRSPGLSVGKLAAGAWAKIEAALRAADFGNLPERLDQSTISPQSGVPCISDAPGARLQAVWADGTQKEVFWDRGCPSQAASDLVDALREAIGYDSLVRPKSQP